MTTITLNKADIENPLLQLKNGSGKIGSFIKSENGGLVFSVLGSYYTLSGMSASAITSFLATVGFGGGMVFGIIATLLFGYIVPKLWAAFWSLFK